MNSNRCAFPGCQNWTPCKTHLDYESEDTESSIVLPPRTSPGLFYGPVGEFAQATADYTEAHRVATYSSCLAFLGALIGPGPYFYQGAVQRAKLFVCTLGASGEARKTAGANVARSLIRHLDPEFNTKKIKTGGISSGEGILEDVRDPEYDNNGAILRGTPDQRQVYLSSEFANILKNGQRGGNSVSDILRQAWDPDPMSMTRRADPALSTNHHISIVANITAEELFSVASATDYEGGLLNRFLFVYATPENEIACPEPLPPDVFRVARPLIPAIENARKVARVTWSEEAKEFWKAVYPDIRRQRFPGRAGDLLARKDTHPIRVAFLLALLDGRNELGLEHLNAGLALQEYVEDSVMFCWKMWGGSLAVTVGVEKAASYEAGNATARVLQEIKVDDHANMAKLYRIFSNHKSKEDLRQLMTALVKQGYFVEEELKTTGRPSRGWKRVR